MIQRIALVVVGVMLCMAMAFGADEVGSPEAKAVEQKVERIAILERQLADLEGRVARLEHESQHSLVEADSAELEQTSAADHFESDEAKDAREKYEEEFERIDGQYRRDLMKLQNTYIQELQAAWKEARAERDLDEVHRIQAAMKEVHKLRIQAEEKRMMKEVRKWTKELEAEERNEEGEESP